MVRKAALGTRSPISLARSILGADPGQREESAGLGAVAPAPRSPPASPPALAGPACQGKRARAYERGRERRECGRPSGPVGGRGVGRVESQGVGDEKGPWNSGNITTTTTG